jgi:hypothetical protein
MKMHNVYIKDILLDLSMGSIDFLWSLEIVMII